MQLKLLSRIVFSASIVIYIITTIAITIPLNINIYTLQLFVSNSSFDDISIIIHNAIFVGSQSPLIWCFVLIFVNRAWAQYFVIPKFGLTPRILAIYLPSNIIQTLPKDWIFIGGVPILWLGGLCIQTTSTLL